MTDTQANSVTELHLLGGCSCCGHRLMDNGQPLPGATLVADSKGTIKAMCGVCYSLVVALEDGRLAAMEDWLDWQDNNKRN